MRPPAPCHAERDPHNHSPDGRSCNLCTLFYPYRLEDARSDGQCRATALYNREKSHIAFHEDVSFDHWCDRFSPTQYALRSNPNLKR